NDAVIVALNHELVSRHRAQHARGRGDHRRIRLVLAAFAGRRVRVPPTPPASTTADRAPAASREGSARTGKLYLRGKTSGQRTEENQPDRKHALFDAAHRF